ncbi:MAG: hypothetical protein ABI811_15075 [Acidobacteriota bacterium]
MPRPFVWTTVGILMGGLAVGQALAKPVVASGSITPSNPLLPGRMVTIYGGELGPAATCVGVADPAKLETASPLRPVQTRLEILVYPVTLCGVRVLIDDTPAGLLYVSEGQINFKVPQTTPMDGTAELRVEYRGELSEPLQVQLGAGRPEITLDSPAYTELPIWLRLKLPFGLGDFEYPTYVHPAATWCYEIEVRRNGVLLQRLPNAEKEATIPVVYSGLGGCGALGLPAERKHRGRLPLHLLYRMDQAGTYEVRFTRLDRFLPDGQALAVSDWTSFEVRATPPGRRAEWLAEVARQAQPDTVALLEDVLPSILGFPDAASLALIEPYLYHPDSLVRRFTANGLRYWTKDEQKAVAMRLLRDRGPSDATVEFLRDQRTEALQATLPYLRSASSLLLSGAVSVIRGLGFDAGAAVEPGLRLQLEDALVGATDRLAEIATPQTRNDYASLLGQIHTAAAHEALWKWVDQGIGSEQATIAITWHNDRADLPRLAMLLERPVSDDKDRTFASLCYALRRTYGEESLPYLERALIRSPAVFVRTNCARELALANRAAGFEFLIDAIGNNRFYKPEMTRFVQDSFAEVRGAGDTALLTFLREHAERAGR